MNKRMDKSKLNVGTYILDKYARTETHIRELSECGIDFVVCMNNDREALDLFSRYNVGAVLSGVVPSWWGGDGIRAGKMRQTNPLEEYLRAAEEFTDHPAVWAIDCGDEPSALDFPYYGEVMQTVNERFANQFAYLNLYPNYASVAKNTDEQTVNQLGTESYEEHIKRYCECVGTDYICYDYYMYCAPVSGAYENLSIVADACLKTGRSMWIVLQVNSFREEEWISLNQLRFQAYSAMAFGAESIIWACYTAGWWHNQVLDLNGEKTEQYAKLRQMNTELHRLSAEYMKYRRASTHFICGSVNSDFEAAGRQTVSSLNTGVFFDVKEESGKSIIVGQMTSRDGAGHQALFVCDASDPLGKSTEPVRICFNTAWRTARVFTGEGEQIPCTSADGSYSFELPPCSGALIAVD